MTDWISCKDKRPTQLKTFDVTTQDREGARFVQQAVFRPESSMWNIQKEPWQEGTILTVKAWKERPEPYQGA